MSEYVAGNLRSNNRRIGHFGGVLKWLMLYSGSHTPLLSRGNKRPIARPSPLTEPGGNRHDSHADDAFINGYTSRRRSLRFESTSHLRLGVDAS